MKKLLIIIPILTVASFGFNLSAFSQMPIGQNIIKDKINSFGFVESSQETNCSLSRCDFKNITIKKNGHKIYFKKLSILRPLSLMYAKKLYTKGVLLTKGSSISYEIQGTGIKIDNKPVSQVVSYLTNNKVIIDSLKGENSLKFYERIIQRNKIESFHKSEIIAGSNKIYEEGLIEIDRNSLPVKNIKKSNHIKIKKLIIDYKNNESDFIRKVILEQLKREGVVYPEEYLKKRIEAIERDGLIKRGLGNWGLVVKEKILNLLKGNNSKIKVETSPNLSIFRIGEILPLVVYSPKDFIQNLQLKIK